MTEEELRTKQETKRRKQHEAWKRWYESPKGIAYRLKVKQKRAGVPYDQA
jgi:hypothetical protein